MQEAKAASMKIHENAATTKNVKGLLKDESKTALRSLEKMRQQLARLGGLQQHWGGGVPPGGPGRDEERQDGERWER